MCFVKPAETRTPFTRERSVSLHDKISTDIDKSLATDMNVEKAVCRVATHFSVGIDHLARPLSEE